MSDILSESEANMAKEGERSEERKRAEEALRETRDYLEKLINYANAPIIIWDPAFRITRFNHAFEHLTGYTADEVIGQELSLLFPEASREESLSEIAQTSSGEHWESVEIPILRKDGETRLALWNSANIYGEDGTTLLATIAQGIDITERKRAEKEVQHHLERLEALREIDTAISSTLDLTEMLDIILEQLERVIPYHSAAIFLLTDDTAKVTAGRGFPDLEQAMQVSLSVKDDALAQQLLEEKQPLVLADAQADERFQGRGGTEYARSWMGVPLVVKGEAIGFLTIDHREPGLYDEESGETALAFASQAAIAIENARLHEQADEKLQHRVAELTALNAIAASLTSTLELDEMLESIVTRVAQVMGARICTIRLVEGDELTIGAAVGYKDESARQHRIKIDARLARIVRDQRPLLIEDLWRAEGIPPRRRTRALREGVHSFLGVPMISREKTIGILSIYREEPHHFREEEVTLLSTVANQTAVAIERARLHERVREHAEDLERLVQERTKELRAIHAELLRSAKLAALGQLAAGVAHELNNPLGAISGYLELLQEEVELGPREMDYMERIEKRIQQSTKIVADLRSVGIPSKPVWQIVNVNDILEEVLTLVEWRLSLHLINVQKEMAPDLPLMHADPDRLEQVFINLITNAKQAMKEGGTLRVASRESRNGEWVEIIFADTGEGIAKSHLDKIFDPFFTTRRPGEAMGLGLSISHRQIKDHGGAIDVWSEKGRGAVFRVALPPSGAKRCWEILDCQEKERCKAVRENADYRCWTVMEDVSRCERCEVYRRKALPPLDGTLLP